MRVHSKLTRDSMGIWEQSWLASSSPWVIDPKGVSTKCRVVLGSVLTVLQLPLEIQRDNLLLRSPHDIVGLILLLRDVD